MTTAELKIKMETLKAKHDNHMRVANEGGYGHSPFEAAYNEAAADYCKARYADEWTIEHTRNMVAAYNALDKSQITNPMQIKDALGYTADEIKAAMNYHKSNGTW
jgi:hypothetical protein